MNDTSRTTRQTSWQGPRKRVSVLAEMALRREKVAERLRELRELNGLSQEQAAQKVEITHRQWQRWETGESVPYPRNLDVIASRFGISIGEFFDELPVPSIGSLDRLERLERKVDALLTKAGLDPAAFDVDSGADDIEEAAEESGATGLLAGRAEAKPQAKPARARKRQAG